MKKAINMAVSVKMNRPAGIVGRIFGSLFFSVFAAAGLFFCGLIATEFYRTIQTYTWERTECVILESSVEEQKQGESPYQLHVNYQYQWHGKECTSDRFALEKAAFSDYSTARKLVEKYRSDTKSTCFVNSGNPAEAILKRRSLWFGLVFFFPLIFVAIGLGGIYAMWRPEKEAVTLTEKPLTSQSQSKFATPLVVGFFMIFFIAGTAVAWFMAIHPFIKIIAAQSWQAIPCTITSSGVQTHSGEDGATYSIEILYTYRFEGREYKSSRYHFVPGSSSGYEGKAAVVRRYPVGRKTICYVNPRDPVEAVLQRGFSSGMWFGILFPIPFLAVGAGGVIYTLRKAGGTPGTGPRENPTWGQEVVRFPLNENTRARTRSRALSPHWSRFRGLMVGILLAAFWNGILSVFLGQAIQSWRDHRPEWFLTIFLIPFVVIGLAFIGYVGYSFLALFNPVVRLDLASSSIRLGEILQLQWRINGSTDRIRRLELYLEGREEVTYRRGTSTSTDKNVFTRYELVNISSQAAMHSGSAQFQVPNTTMHSFTSPNNEIIWTLYVYGEIPHWPDIKDKYPIHIAPLSLEHFPQT